MKKTALWALLITMTVMALLVGEAFALGGNLHKTIDCPRASNMKRGFTYSAYFNPLTEGTYHPEGVITAVSVQYIIAKTSEERPISVEVFNGYTSETMGYISQVFRTQFAGKPIKDFYGPNATNSFGISFTYSTIPTTPLVIGPDNVCIIYVNWTYDPPPAPEPPTVNIIPTIVLPLLLNENEEE